VFTWLRKDGTTNCAGVGCFRIQARARSAAGNLCGVHTLSDGGRNANDPQVAVDPNGDAVFVWTRYDGTNNRIQARARSAAGNLSIVQTLSTSGQNASNPQVAVDDGGRAVFTWERYDGAEWRAQTRARSAAGLFLSAVQTLSDAGESALFPQVAVDADGDAVFTWRRLDGSGLFCCFRAQARARSTAGTLSAVQTLSSGGRDAFDPHVAVDPDGNAVFTWTRSDGANIRIQAKARSAAGALSPVQYLSEAGQDAQGPRVGVDADGDAVFTWARSDGTNLRVQARKRSANGALSRPVQTLSSAGQDAKAAQVAVDTTGDAVATWRRSDGANLRVQGVAGP
jgi:microcompartment protein CcmK/EutM